MTLVIGIFIPFLAINSGLMIKFSAIFTKRCLSFYSRAGIIAEEAISTIRAAVAFGAQKKLSDHYDSYLSEARKEGFKKSLLVGFTLSIMLFGIYVCDAWSLWFGSKMIKNNELFLGQVISIYSLIITGYFSLTIFFDYIQAISLATGASSKIFEIIDRVPSINIASDTGNKPENVVGHIQFKNINFIYPTRPDVKTLNNISFNVEPGSTVAIVGSSGSGKSTIVSLMLRFYDPLSGDLFLDAENVSYGLIGSIYENLPDNEKRERIVNACKMADAHDFIMNFPDKYETMVGERGILLSGGQKQRIAIARAIIKDPKILLLDEATSALDTQSESIVQNVLDKTSRGRTTIIVAHRLSTIRNATKIIVMNKGVIVESGTHKELMDKRDSYFKLVETQQIQQNLKNREEFNILNSSIIPPKDDFITSFTIKDNDHQFNLTEQKSDIEIGLKLNDHNYTILEFIKKVVIINGLDFFMFSIGCLYPVFAIPFANVIQAFSKTGDILYHETTFWALIILVFAVMIFLVNIIQNVILGIFSEMLTERIRSIHLSLDVTYINVSLIIGWKLTLVYLCCIPLMIGAGRLRIKMASNFQQRTKKAYEYSAQIACEGADNIRTVAALTYENNLWERYHNLLDEPMRQSIKHAFLVSIPFAFANCVIFLVNSLAFWYGSKLLISSEYDLKKIYTIYTAIIVGLLFSGRLFAYAPDIAKAKSASNSIMSLLERVPKIDTWCQDGEKIKTVKGHLKFSNVHFHYPTRLNVPVLRGLNLEVKPGQYTALVGPSGVLLKESSLYDITIKENILLGCLPGQNVTQNDLEKVCQEANIHNFIIGLPNGYDTFIGGKGIQLSGGQKQRITIARALIRNPKILLLDEATSSLDSESEKAVQKALNAAAHGRTTLAIAHRLSTIQHADIMFVIKDGKVYEQGTHQELLELQGIYYMMIQKQHLGESNL
ncbi:P-loop containing nucleoside triphosphate hydrolase protein [Gigaspora rosea]|uniref:P-loop containing nucleoside triphosphate hydrolase protein n=1 Tax=Gigaspora rosea TaxID=44941 RepID=A0A397VU97_9GLOM|nr:P-loop containing nucleoside triphosphate hydrolase protein [Gigaspora rosea]